MTLAAPLLGIVLAVGLLVASRGLDTVAAPGQLGPAFWPRLVLVGLIAACAATALPGRRSGGAERGVTLPAIARGRLAAAIALVVLYVVLAPILGFALATAAFIAVFLVLCGMRVPVVIGVSAVAGTVALLYLFVKLVYLPLPKGAGPIESLTVALYRTLGIF